tara:strand:+ start:143 stop:325 length:183 start_codon:yes stop_codon:yes gene_type:complete
MITWKLLLTDKGLSLYMINVLASQHGRLKGLSLENREGTPLYRKVKHHLPRGMRNSKQFK